MPKLHVGLSFPKSCVEGQGGGGFHSHRKSHYMYMYKINLNVKLNETKFSLLAHSTHHGKLHETLFFVVISMIKIAVLITFGKPLL